jgi:hypothetical protein
VAWVINLPPGAQQSTSFRSYSNIVTGLPHIENRRSFDRLRRFLCACGKILEQNGASNRQTIDVQEGI